MTKKYIAVVIFEKELSTISMEYTTKKDFYHDLRKNGYSVRFISTEENFNKDCEKWHERNETAKNINKRIYESDKKSAERMNMTVKQYRIWLSNKY